MYYAIQYRVDERQKKRGQKSTMIYFSLIPKRCKWQRRRCEEFGGQDYSTITFAKILDLHSS